MLDGKFMIIHLLFGLIKRMLYIKMSYFPPCDHRKNEVALDLLS